jgi:Tfp pilus assembly protein PilZ
MPGCADEILPGTDPVEGEAMQLQRQQRIAKRLPCSIRVSKRRYSGLVLNLSQGGVYVQTNAEAGRGSSVVLELQVPDEGPAIALEGTVAWRKVVPGQLRQLTGGGFGLRIQNADERYYQALARWLPCEPDAAGAEGSPEPVTDGPARLTWRVRVRARGGPRSRLVTVEAATVEAAHSEALRHTGEGWRVIEVEAL